jgi:hypothetical protein
MAMEVVDRIVRQSFGRFRLCWETVARTNVRLAGRVGVRFVIGRDGAVRAAKSDDRTTIHDGAMGSCVASAFQSLSFPAPDGGIVTVIYTLDFTPR